MIEEAEKKSFLAFDVQKFLDKMRVEQLRNAQKHGHNHEAVARYEFLISAVEAEHLVSVVPVDRIETMRKPVDTKRWSAALREPFDR